MSEPMQRRHGLEPFLGQHGDVHTSDSAVRITVRGDLGHINLRGNPADEKFVATVEDTIGQPLPLTPNTLTSEPNQVFWLGPDEWLIVTQAERAALMAETLGAACSGFHAAVNDISGGQVALMINGSATRDILSKGCTLDLHETVFSAGCCGQSGLAKANVLLACLDDAPGFMVVVRRSFADYLCRWLLRAARPGGARFTDA
jgi:sarcosine oxidase subunit gamma